METINILIGISGQRQTYAESSSGKSSTSTKISTEHLTLVLDKLKNNQTRDSTINNYLSIWRKLNKFLLNLDDKIIGSWEQKTALFGAYLVDNGAQSSTLKSYFSAIKFILKLDGYQWDDNKVLLNALVRSCKLVNDCIKTRLPIQKGLLEMLLFETTRYYDGPRISSPQPYLAALYKAIFCLAYYGMMRVGELAESEHCIKACNIHLGNNKDKILIVLYSSKTHGKESRPQKIKITATNVGSMKFNNKHFCPFEIVTKYMKIRGDYLDENEQFFIYADRSPVLPHHVRKILRTLLDNLNLNSILYDVHSFRAGRTSDLEKFGYPIEMIKSLGRWRSNAVYRYFKN